MTEIPHPTYATAAKPRPVPTFLSHNQIRERYRDFIQLHNAVQTKPLFLIRGMRTVTLMLVVRKSLQKARSLQDRPAYGQADPHALPSFYTSRAEMARLMECGPRSVYNYLSLLEAAGVLQKTFHGHKCNFEITLHPWFYFRRGFGSPAVVDVACAQAGSGERWTKPMFRVPVEPVAGPGDGSGEEADPAGEGTPAGRALPGEPVVARPAAPLPQPLPTLRDFGMRLTQLFWQQARQTLWPEEYLSPDYERRLLNLVWSDVMGGFEGCEEDGQMTALYRVRLDQLLAAVGYARRQGWTSFLPPPLYFARARFEQEQRQGTKGSFWWTFEWFKQSEEAKKWQFRRQAVQRAVHSLAHLKAPQALNGGAEVGHLELYRYWEQRLARQGDAELDRAFQLAVANLNPSGGSAAD